MKVKKNLFCLFFCVILISCFGVKAQSQIDSLTSYFNENQFVKAHKLIDKEKKSIAETNGKNNIVYLSLLLYQARIYFNEEKNTLSKEVFEEISKSDDIIKSDDNFFAGYLNAYGLLLIKESNYTKAENFFKRAQEIYLNNEGEQSYSYLITCFSLANTYQANSKLSEAETLLYETLIKWKTLYSGTDYFYVSKLYDLSTIQINKGNYSDAETNTLTCLDLLAKLNQKESSVYCYALANLGAIYKHKGDFNNAEHYLKESLIEANKVFGDKNLEYAKLLEELASIYFEKANYIKAEELYLKSAAIIKQKKGEQSEDYSNLLNKLGSIYLNKTDFKSAEKDYLQSLEIIIKIYGKTHPLYGVGVSYIATLKSKTGNLDISESLFVEALNIFKTKLGETHPSYLVTIYNLSRVYIDKKNYDKAEYYTQLGLGLSKKEYGESHPSYLKFMNNFGYLYSEMGNNEKAEKYFLNTLELTKKIYGDHHPNTAICISNLGSLYLKTNLKKAEELYLLDLELTKNTFGINHINYASSLNKLSQVYSLQSMDSKSLNLNTESLNIVKKALGENCLEYASSLSFLGSDYVHLIDYSKAEECYLNALNIRRVILGENHPLCQLIESNLSYLYSKQNNDTAVSKYLLSGFISFKNQMLEVSNFLSYSEMNLYNERYSSSRFTPLSFLQRYPAAYPEINIGCYENELLVKNLSLRNQQRIKKSIQKSGDKALKDKYEQFIANKRQLNKLQELHKDNRPVNFESLSTETEQLEKDLTRQSVLFADTKNALAVNWTQVQEKLKDNEVAIDIVTYNYFNKKWTDSIVYAAFVVKKGFKAPKYIPLFEQKQLEFLLVKNNNEKEDSRIDRHYNEKAIANLFLKPLQKDFEGVNTIYLSPSGLGHQIDFSALPVSDTQTLGEKYKVHIMGSTAELVNYKVAQLGKNSKLEMLLYGSIDYSKRIDSKTATDTLKNSIVDEFYKESTRSGIGGFGYLAGTKLEIEQIKTNSQENGFTAIIIEDKKATEESIKELDGRKTPFVLHLATHGFFFPDPKQELPKTTSMLLDGTSQRGTKAMMYKTSDDPMMRSGLLFAGANKFWGKTAENQTTDDGILTASEISNLDLSGCQLVVMSACETGLGEINGSEGVFGLQRAFKMAGVKNIIMSLWKVPDTQTAELFNIFYKACFTFKSIHEAFQLAQAEMKKKYTPYYWAGFVLLE